MNIETSTPEKSIDNENEYPIIWYDESNFDSEEKMALKLSFQKKEGVHLFSEFEEAVKFVQSLRTSFLLILSNYNFDQQKLFKDFEALKDTYGRRLIDFEEKFVLQELSREISDETAKTFKIFVFYTREDFESEMIENEDILGLMKRQNIQDVSSGFREEFLFWERKQKGLEKPDAIFEDTKQVLDEFSKEDCLKCRKFCMRRLKELAKKRGHEKEKILYYVNLGESSRQLEEYQKALEFHGKAFDILKSIYGEKHPSVGKLNNAIGSVYYVTRELKKALKCWTMVLNIRKSVYGERHSYTASSYYNIALVWDDLRKYEESLEYHLKALEITKSIYGETHLETAYSFFALAQVYKGLRKFKIALEYHLKALHIFRISYEERHLETAQSYYIVAGVYRQLGDFPKAIQCNLKALDLYKFMSHESPSQNVQNKLREIQNSLRECQKTIEKNIKTYNT